MLILILCTSLQQANTEPDPCDDQLYDHTSDDTLATLISDMEPPDPSDVKYIYRPGTRKTSAKSHRRSRLLGTTTSRPDPTQTTFHLPP